MFCFFYSSGHHQHLHSFPTRRSSDLTATKNAAALDRLQRRIDEDKAELEGRLGERIDNKKDRSEEHTSELQSRFDLVCRLLLEKKKNKKSCPSENCEYPRTVRSQCNG